MVLPHRVPVFLCVPPLQGDCREGEPLHGDTLHPGDEGVSPGLAQVQARQVSKGRQAQDQQQGRGLAKHGYERLLEQLF